MKSRFLAFTAAMAIAGAGQSPAAADQTPSEPAGARAAPQPSIEEELVYLRDIIALQTLRLDEAEQKLERATGIIETQQRRIESLEKSVGVAVAAGGMTAGVHVVASGDTLYSISRRYGASVDEVAAANKLRPPYTLSVGQQLSVPGAAPAPAQPAPQAPAQVLAQKPAEPAAKAAPATAESAPKESQRVAAASSSPGPTAAERPDVTERALEAQRRQEEEGPKEGELPQEVGVRPEEEEEKPYLAIFSDVGGILTPKGSMYLEPSTDFTVTSDNRFFFQGVEIIDAVLVGAIEATDSNRRASTQSLGFRYGVTSRLELDGRLSYVLRDDRVTGVAIDDQTTTTRNLEGTGFGDAEMGVHYQLNRGIKFPYLIANLRAKAPTGKGPYEISRTTNRGAELELPTGSGYWTIEPSLTFILPTSPAVIFGNVGYQVNMAASPDARVGGATIREFDAGDAIRTSLGVGLSLNERLSINLGYDQSVFLKTHTLTETPGAGGPVLTDIAQPSATVGSFLFGGSYALSNRTRINLNAAFGATDEAPDMRISLRAQWRLFD
ncbi:MAG: LysM peptidoglycan-binding domain-containing protein [Amphiplicatus sp.]